jgi:hypothetical protein
MYSRFEPGGGSIGLNSIRQRPGTAAFSRWMTDWAPI